MWFLWIVKILWKYCCLYVLVKIIDNKVKIIILICDIHNKCIHIVVEHGIENLTTCVYSKIDFYLLEKSYPLSS